MDPLVQRVLDEAGWEEGRDRHEQVEAWLLSLAGEFGSFPAAEAALLAFGGLAVTQRGPGLNLAREPFVLDPTLGTGEGGRFARYAEVLGMRLFPIGECSGGAFFLAIGEDGRVFAVGDTLNLVGGTIHEAVENLVLGRRGAGFGAR